MQKHINATIQIAQQGIISQVARQAKRIFNQDLHLFSLAVMLAVLVWAVLLIPVVYAAGFTVDTIADSHDDTPGDGMCADSAGACSLRAAIEEANALVGSDTIDLAVSGPYLLTLGELTVSSEIILNGNGETISAEGLSRIFYVTGTGRLSLNGVTLQDGVADVGGGILNNGGTLNILDSAIVSNTATIQGGGINNYEGILNIANSTISGNRANRHGGGLIHLGFGPKANLTNVTITNNIADSDYSGDGHGGGVYVSGTQFNFKNSIVAGNSVGAGDLTEPDLYLIFMATSYGHNLIGITSAFPPGTPNGNGDFVGAITSPLDPLLDGLTGSPPYHPLLGGSLAIDQVPMNSTFISTTGNPLFTDGAPITTDQLGTARPQGLHCDIGAVEVAPTAALADVGITKSVDPTMPVVPGQTITYTLSFSNAGEGTATGVVITDIVPTTLTNVSVISSGVAITDSGTSPGFVWYVEDLSQDESGIITISGQVNPDLTEATTFNNTATIATSTVDSNPDNNEAVVSVTVIPESPESGWQDICVPQRMEITGIGMGDWDNVINPQSLSLADPAGVNWLLAQMAGRYYGDAPTPEHVIFTTDTPQLVTLSEPTSSLVGYTFETNLQPASQITVSVSNPGNSYKTPRGLILYSKRTIADSWTSIGKTTNNFVWRGSKDTHTEVLTFPPLEEATDLSITAVVIDNDDDTRPLVVEALAGGVMESVTEPAPTDGIGLNIVNLALPQVPTGTNQASITLRSPSGNGDSLVLVGLNVSFPCPESTTGAVFHVVPTPATIPLGATELLTISVTPNLTEVNGVQINGRVDPAYLRLVDLQPTNILTEELDPPVFDSLTGEFRYRAGLLGNVITEPFAALVLEVQAVATTTGTPVEFLDTFPPTDISGPGGSVMREAQDGLVIVTQGPTLRGTVDMQGRPPAKPAPPWAIPLTVSLTPAGGSTPAHAFDTTTNQKGEFLLSLGDVIPGQYDVRIKGNHTLRNLAPNVSLVAGANQYFFDTLLEGDVETDTTFNQVLQADSDLLSSSFNICLGQSGFVANADLDESGCVVLTDFSLLSTNFGVVGDIIVTPTSLKLLQAQTSSSGAVMRFDAEEMVAVVGEVVTLTVDIDPRGEPINGVQVHGQVDPTYLELIDIQPTGVLSTELDPVAFDPATGEFRYGAGLLGGFITEPFSVLTLEVQAVATTTNTLIEFLDTFPPTDISGSGGSSVLAEATGITLNVGAQEEGQRNIYLPIIEK